MPQNYEISATEPILINPSGNQTDVVLVITAEFVRIFAVHMNLTGHKLIGRSVLNGENLQLLQTFGESVIAVIIVCGIEYEKSENVAVLGFESNLSAVVELSVNFGYDPNVVSEIAFELKRRRLSVVRRGGIVVAGGRREKNCDKSKSD